MSLDAILKLLPMLCLKLALTYIDILHNLRFHALTYKFRKLAIFPGSDPYLLDSGPGSPTLLVTNIPEPPSSSSWYDKETPLHQPEEKLAEKREDTSRESLVEEYEVPVKELSEDKSRLEKNPFSNENETEYVVSTLKDASQKSSQVEKTEDLNPFGESSEEDKGVEIKDVERKVEEVAASKSVVRGYSQSFSRKEEPKVGMFYM